VSRCCTPTSWSRLIHLPDRDSCRTGIDRVFAAGAAVNGGASVSTCVAEGVQAAEEIDRGLCSIA